MNKQRINIISFSSLILFVVLLFSCKEQEEYVPNAPVNFTVDLNQFNSLTTPGFSQKYEYDGYAGVIVYCSYYDFTAPSNSQYYAYDAVCTLEMHDSCSVINENHGLTAVCPCCSTTYSLLDGYPTSGDAPYPLKEYKVTLIGNKLHVTN